MAGVPARGVHIPGAAVDLSGDLVACIERLGADGFRIDMWTPPLLARAFLSVKGFMKNVRFLTNEQDPVLFTRLLALGNRDGWWETPASCTAIQMYKFCGWLKTVDGTARLNEMRKVRRLEKKAQPGQTVEEVALVAAFDEQLAEYEAMKKKTRLTYETRLLELRRQITLTQRELETVMKGHDADFAPA